MIKRGKEEELRWFEHKFLPIVGIALMAIAYVVWEWKGVLLVLFLGFMIEGFKKEAKHARVVEAFREDIDWLQKRLQVVDPSWEADFAAATLYEQRLQPPPDEIVGLCPECEHTIKRRELGLYYNGGHR